MSCHNVMVVLLNHRSNIAPKFQEVLTKYGCVVKTRIGLHETGDVCSQEGLIVLHLSDNQDEISLLEKDLKSLKGIKIETVKLECEE